MRGWSGATLMQEGDHITKVCDNASDQVQWFTECKRFGMVEGIKTVDVYWRNANRYTMNHVVGHLATHEPQTTFISRLYDQIKHWQSVYPLNFANWHDYIQRLYEHAEVTDSSTIFRAVEMIEQFEPLEQSFCHGDLTLENMIVDASGDVWLIDPNFSGNLYQSWLLDAGKLLQSTHTRYHELMGSNAGVTLRKHDQVLIERLERDGVYQTALMACLTHIIRLCKYQRDRIDAVEALALPLMKELEWI